MYVYFILLQCRDINLLLFDILPEDLLKCYIEKVVGLHIYILYHYIITIETLFAREHEQTAISKVFSKYTAL